MLIPIRGNQSLNRSHWQRSHHSYLKWKFQGATGSWSLDFQLMFSIIVFNISHPGGGGRTGSELSIDEGNVIYV